MDHLKLDSFRATGTIRSNRVENGPLTDVKKFAKNSRGACEFAQDVSSDILLVRWHNNVVTLAPNCHSATPVEQAKRWSNRDYFLCVILFT